MGQKVTRFSLDAVRSLRRVYGCVVSDAIAKLTPAERKEYDAAMKDPTISSHAIVRVLVARGLRINTTSLISHRKGRCLKCFGIPR